MIPSDRTLEKFYLGLKEVFYRYAPRFDFRAYVFDHTRAKYIKPGAGTIPPADLGRLQAAPSATDVTRKGIANVSEARQPVTPEQAKATDLKKTMDIATRALDILLKEAERQAFDMTVKTLTGDAKKQAEEMVVIQAKEIKEAWDREREATTNYQYFLANGHVKEPSAPTEEMRVSGVTRAGGSGPRPARERTTAGFREAALNKAKEFLDVNKNRLNDIESWGEKFLNNASGSPDTDLDAKRALAAWTNLVTDAMNTVNDAERAYINLLMDQMPLKENAFGNTKKRRRTRAKKFNAASRPASIAQDSTTTG